MILRPNLDELVNKLNEAKKEGIDVILCTTANIGWVEEFFNLKPEFKDLFNKVYTRDNENEWRNYSANDYPFEYDAKFANINIEYMKPVTTFGYDSILFIDDNRIEGLRLKLLFDITDNRLNKDVTYFSALGFKGDTKNDVGCHIMCLAIDDFIKKEFKRGFCNLDKEI